jgi:hypothetical protein
VDRHLALARERTGEKRVDHGGRMEVLDELQHLREAFGKTAGAKSRDELGREAQHRRARLRVVSGQGLAQRRLRARRAERCEPLDFVPRRRHAVDGRTRRSRTRGRASRQWSRPASSRRRGP